MPDYPHTELGKSTQYTDQYSPQLLCPIPRDRTHFDHDDKDKPLFYGVDWWTAYEISWLNPNGLPQMAIGEFAFPCTSHAIVESKSFKLYLNSYNQTHFNSMDSVVERLKADLSAAVQAKVEVALYDIADYHSLRPISEPSGTCIDQQEIAIHSYQPDRTLLSVSKSHTVREVLYSHLLRSNCPVTNQPDWASIYIDYQGAKLHPEGLLKYIVSFRQHQDFHEHCVEQIFMDITSVCQPKRLSVYARYLRRGGLDINPLRSSLPSEPPSHRQVRQ